ncbi:hypothetical protein BHE90_015821 [Fusarium euwallaceae]|uniref:Uncharacterized protein n=1 Tax=Fusarium euwallaceae TaxID=1147111 RepID=A0A430L2B6_9HYPO|nr:hypothetical protein BHE90_015821 [Fusarium euwallaceae]
MCQHCRSNTARYIAGHAVREYRERFLNGEEWRLKLCTNLQAILLINLCDLKITPDTAIRHNKDLRNSLWSRSGLDFRYDHNFGSVLRTKYADKAQSLLSEINKWDAFIVVQSGDQKLYYWNTDILIRHFNSVDQVARWIEDKRAQARARYEHQVPSTPGPIRRRRVTLSDHHGTGPTSSPYYRAPEISRQHRRGFSLTEARGTMPPPSTPTTPRFRTNMQLAGYSLQPQPQPSSPTQSRPLSLSEALHEMIVGERKVEDMMKRMEITPSSSLTTSPRNSWVPGNTPTSGTPNPQTPSRSMPQPVTMPSSTTYSQPGTPQTPSRFTTSTSPAAGTPLNLNLTPIPLNLGSLTRDHSLGVDQPAFGQNAPLFQPVQVRTAPAAQPDPQYEPSLRSVITPQSLPPMGNPVPLGFAPQPGSQFIHSPVQAFEQAGSLHRPADQSMNNAGNISAIQTPQPATESAHQSWFQPTGPTQHVALQESTVVSCESTPLVTQLLSHHHRQQSTQRQPSNISTSERFLSADYQRTLHTSPPTASAQSVSAPTAPIKRNRPNFHFGLSPLPVPPEALTQPQETDRAAPVMPSTGQGIKNTGFTNYRDPTMDDEMDEMDVT